MTIKVVLTDDQLTSIDTRTRAQVLSKAKRIVELDDQISKLLVGRRCIIQSAFNDQPYGRSKKRLTGEVRKIEAAHVSDSDGRVMILLEDCRCYMALDEVELLKVRR